MMFSTNRNLADSPRSRLRAWRVVPFALLIFLPVVWMFLGPMAGFRAARAQQPPSSSKPPPEVLALFNDIDDIAELKVLNPLKLTPDQLDKIASAISEAKATYDKKVTDLIVPPVQKMGPEIRDTRKRMLAGEAVPKEFDDKVKALEEDYYKGRDKLNLENFQGMIEKIKGILTTEQIATAIKLMKAAPNAKNLDPNAADAQWFNIYVLDVFINYARIVPLLKEMHDASAPPAAGAK